MKQPILGGVLESPLDLNGHGFVNIGGLLGTFEVPLTFSAPLSRSGNTISIPAATGGVNGYLMSTDWTTFNSKATSAQGAKADSAVQGISIANANGVSGSSSGGTTPALTLVLGAIVPTSVAASGAVSGSNLSGTNTGDQTISLTGDVTGSGTGSFAATIANSAVSLAKMANMATASLIYRKTAGSGAPEVNTLATLKTDLGLTGTNTGDQDLSGYQTKAGALALAGFSSITGRIGSTNLPLGAQLYDNAGTPKLAVDLASRELFNSLGHPTVNFDQGYIYDGTVDEIVLFNFASQSFFDYQGFESADFSNRLIFDHQGGNFPSINFDLRQLIANDGSTVALDWSDPTQLDIFGGVIQFFPSGELQVSNINASTVAGDGSGLTNVTPAVGSIGSVIAGTKTATGTATTTFTVTIGVTMANTTYKVTTEGDNALSSAVHYVNNKTTTTFDIVYLAGLSGPVSIDWIVSP